MAVRCSRVSSAYKAWSKVKSWSGYSFHLIVSVLKIHVEGFEDEVLAGAEGLIRESRPVILLEILGGMAYLGAPTRGFHPPATVRELERIHATWRRIEAFGYSVGPVLDYDYIALPRPDA